MWSPRAQVDKKRYRPGSRYWSATPRIEWVIGAVPCFSSRTDRRGVALEDGAEFGCGSVVVTTGTFLNGLIDVGREQRAAGRWEPPSRPLAESLKALGFPWGRLNTGTPPRLHKDSIDFYGAVARGEFTEQPGDGRSCRFPSPATE